MAMLELTKENFAELAEKSAQPVVLEFWAPWCTYCRRIAGVVAKLPEAYEGRAAVAQINIDNEPQLAERFGVDTIPSFILLRDGKPSEKLVAPGSKADIDAWMQEQGA